MPKTNNRKHRGEQTLPMKGKNIPTSNTPGTKANNPVNQNTKDQISNISSTNQLY